jgi:hypothetical protein
MPLFSHNEADVLFILIQRGKFDRKPEVWNAQRVSAVGAFGTMHIPPAETVILAACLLTPTTSSRLLNTFRIQCCGSHEALHPRSRRNSHRDHVMVTILPLVVTHAHHVSL